MSPKFTAKKENNEGQLLQEKMMSFKKEPNYSNGKEKKPANFESEVEKHPTVVEKPTKKKILTPTSEKEKLSTEEEIDALLLFEIGKKGKELYPKNEKFGENNPEMFFYKNRGDAVNALTKFAQVYKINQKDIEYALNNKALFTLVEKLNLKRAEAQEKHVRENEEIKTREKKIETEPEKIKTHKARLVRVIPREETLARLEEELRIAEEVKNMKPIRSLEEIKKDIEDTSTRIRKNKIEDINTVEKNTKSNLRIETENDKAVRRQEESMNEIRIPKPKFKPSNLEMEKDKEEFDDIDEKTINSALEKADKKETTKLKLDGDDKEKIEKDTKQEKTPAEKILTALNADSEKIDKEAKEKGYADIVWNTVEKYRKLPLKTKLLVSAGLIGSAFVSASIGGAVGTAIATAAFAGSVGQRTLGGLSTFVALEGFLSKRVDKKYENKTEGFGKDWEKKKATALAAVAGIAVASGIIGKSFGYIFEQTGISGGASDITEHVKGADAVAGIDQIKIIARAEELAQKMGININGNINLKSIGGIPTEIEGIPVPHELFSTDELEKITKLQEFGESIKSNDIPISHLIENDAVNKIEEDLKKIYGEKDFPTLSPEEEAVLENDIKAIPHPIETVPQEYEVKPGDNLWNIIKENFKEKGLFENLKEGQKIHLIDSIKDRFAEMSPEKLRQLGISSGNINKLSVGDKLSLADIMNKESNITDAINKTLALSQEQIQNIEHGTAESAQKISENISTNNISKIPEQVIYTDASGEEVISGKEIPVTPEDVQRALGGGEVSPEPTTGTSTPVAVPAEAIDNTLRSEVDTLFGTKGFLGFGSSSGVDTPEWKTIQKMTVEDLFTQASTEPDDSLDTVIDNDYLRGKIVRMSSYLESIGTSIGISPEKNETVLSFIKRVISKNLENIK